MVWLILAVLALFVFQTLLPASIRYYATGDGLLRNIRIAVGPRDSVPAMPVAGERAARALANLSEAMPVFLGLALLSLVLGVSEGLAATGAAIFLVARIAYVPCYVFGIFGLRSVVWAAGHAGLLLIGIAVARAG